MTVKELKEALEQYDENLDVMVSTRDYRGYMINGVGPCLDQESAIVEDDIEWELEQNPDLDYFIVLDIDG